MDNGAALPEFITRDDAFACFQELQANIQDIMGAFNAMKEALNNQAEVLGLCRYTIQKYLPIGHLEEAAQEYRALRLKQVEEARLESLAAGQGPKDVN